MNKIKSCATCGNSRGVACIEPEESECYKYSAWIPKINCEECKHRVNHPNGRCANCWTCSYQFERKEESPILLRDRGFIDDITDIFAALPGDYWTVRKGKSLIFFSTRLHSEDIIVYCTDYTWKVIQKEVREKIVNIEKHCRTCKYSASCEDSKDLTCIHIRGHVVCAEYELWEPKEEYKNPCETCQNSHSCHRVNPWVGRCEAYVKTEEVKKIEQLNIGYIRDKNDGARVLMKLRELVDEVNALKAQRSK
jgi:hypothetical protein